MINVPNLIRELEEIETGKQELRRRSMIFQYEFKVVAAQLVGLPDEVFCNLSCKKWGEVHRSIEQFRKEALDSYRGNDQTTNGKIWDDYSVAHPEKIKAVRDSILHCIQIKIP